MFGMHRNSTKWQIPVQPGTNISQKWRNFALNVSMQVYANSSRDKSVNAHRIYKQTHRPSCIRAQSMTDDVTVYNNLLLAGHITEWSLQSEPVTNMPTLGNIVSQSLSPRENICIMIQVYFLYLIWPKCPTKETGDSLMKRKRCLFPYWLSKW